MARRKNIESPEKLLELFNKWRDLVKNNPRMEYVLAQKTAEPVALPRERALTWQSFESWLFENHFIAKLEDYKKNRDNCYSEFSDVIAYIYAAMDSDKLDGAMVGVYNGNIVSQLLGLTTKSESQNTITLQNTTIKWGDKEINI
jgi:23S rRNA G2069 N7-methylase RlmK/C1962 C5-methylase RlmI